MKTSKKLTIMGLSAATALVAATGAVSSFAWFAANSSVTATGMVVKANATESYLQIKNHNMWDETNSKIVENTDKWDITTSDYKSAANVMNPAKNALLSPTHATKTAVEGTGSETLVEWVAGDKPCWAYATANTTTSAAKASVYTDKSTEANNLGANGFTLYNQFDLRIRPATDGSSELKTGALTASVTWAETPENDLACAVRVLVVNETNSYTGRVFDDKNFNGSSSSTFTDSVTLANSMSSKADDTRIGVYVYFDGEDAHCFSNNANNLYDYKVNVTFAVAAVTA